jgi:hypothetical protein
MVFTFGVRSRIIQLVLFSNYDDVGSDWEKAKTQCECLDYLFEIGVKMKLAGLETVVEPETKNLE